MIIIFKGTFDRGDGYYHIAQAEFIDGMALIISGSLHEAYHKNLSWRFVYTEAYEIINMDECVLYDYDGTLFKMSSVHIINEVASASMVKEYLKIKLV